MKVQKDFYRFDRSSLSEKLYGGGGWHWQLVASARRARGFVLTDLYKDIGGNKFLWAIPTPRSPRAPREPCEKKISSAEQLKTFANGFEIPLVLRTLATSCQCHPLNANCLFINIKISYFSAYGALPTV